MATVIDFVSEYLDRSECRSWLPELGCEALLVIPLHNMRLVLRPGGKMIAFWPLASAPSVKLLGLWHRFLNRRGERGVELHPPEITLISSRSQVEQIIESAGWRLVSYSVSASDLFIQAVIVCE